MPTKKHTPASRARERARKVPSAVIPTAPPKADRQKGLERLTLSVRGRDYMLGPAVAEDPGMSASIDGAAQLTVQVRDPRRRLRAALGTEAERQKDGGYISVNGIVYALQSVSSDGTGLVVLTLEDEVKDRLTRFDRFISMRRTEVRTFSRFALRLVNEARRAPLEHFDFFCPELRDRQRVPDPVNREDQRAKAGRAGRRRGTGAEAGYRVKGALANARQRSVIDAILTELVDEGAGQLMMTAAIMVATQESRMGLDTVSVSGIHHGAFHQDASYGTVAQRMDTTHATAGFARVWKQRNGSLRTVHGDLAQAAERVQVSGLPANYRQWQKEAARTVAKWLNAGTAGGGSSGRIVKVEPYKFTRGERHGQRENSWDCLGRYATERVWRRWAYLNTLWLASDEELRAAAPSLEIDGDESWLLEEPSYDWAARRTVSEVRLRVLAGRWGLMPGAVVSFTQEDIEGRYLVSEVNGGMVSPEAEVVCRRPAPSKPEPAPETSMSTVRLGSSGLADVAGSNTVKAAAQAISRKGYPYAWGGGHQRAGFPSRSIRPGESQVGYDCSGYVCAILAGIGHGFRVGGPVMASGALESWGSPGRGRVYTVYATGVHTFIEFADGSRADTSPHGCGENGPRYRTCKRTDQSGFVARHWSGF